MKPIYLIGDVHGCYKTMIALIEKLPKDAEICFLGDLIDRGQNSASVIQYVIDNNHYCVRGNHEDMMINYQPPGPYGETSAWFTNGGMETFENYNDFETLNAHRNWLKKLPLFIEFKDKFIKTDKKRSLVVSHSSVAGVWNKMEDRSWTSIEDHILWNRDVKKNDISKDGSIFNVFGHTIFSEAKIEDHYACIDTGCVYKREKYGHLTALEFPSLRVITQKNIED